MQVGFNFSSFKAFEFSHTSATTHLNTNQKNPKEEMANKDAKEQTSEILSNTSLNNEHLSDFQKIIMDKALKKVSQIKDEMLKMWEEVFGVKPNNSSQSTHISVDSLLNTSLEQKVLGNGISISQGFSQSLQISIQGTILANDGTKKQLDISIGISQSFMQNLQISGIGNAQGGQTPNRNVIDPLVIDYEGNGTELSDTKMQFDLDSDGKPNQIATLKKGSGFLALDKNNDGKINNGSELFGTKSGDGFKDLSIYDSNKDGKIDKEDPIYDKLRIWTPNSNGEGKLVGLGEKGVGVIYLNPQESEELMRGKRGDLLGIKRKSADFLYDNGGKGKIHHIDLVSEQIKNKALYNQAQNDAILRQNTTKHILTNKAYSTPPQNIQTSNLNTSNQNHISLKDGILNGILSNSNINFSSNIAMYISVSINSLQNGKNGVSRELSEMWIKLENNFNKLQMGNLVNSLIEHFESSYQEINRLLVESHTLKQSKEAFKENSLSTMSLAKLLGA
ncbi:hypothetical protein [Helicobacter sp.]|uniref:hypothetical protein n=1 Tax=Helicobacter sp. TaxID=218 RepID=UPI0025B883CB|nr:hypothetical protein [Helicobacter sp.]MCI5969000.1 hypothetical protein [Helicobacter sp.]MDY2584124.1 hypothetical protein [Helicobacter sp.]